MSVGSERIYTSRIEIDMEVVGGYAQVRFCDCGASYWDGARLILAQQNDSDLIREIAGSIRDEATEIARSLVSDLRNRIHIRGGGEL